MLGGETFLEKCRMTFLQQQKDSDIFGDVSGRFSDSFLCFSYHFFREWPRYCRKVYWTKMVQKWSKRPFWSKCPYSEPDFGIRDTKMDPNGPFWSILA